LTFEDAIQLLQAAQAEEARCQSLRSTSKKRLEDAAVQLEEAERELFNAQLSLGHVRYIFKKSNVQLPEPGRQDQVLHHAIKVNSREFEVAKPLSTTVFTYLSSYPFYFPAQYVAGDCSGLAFFDFTPFPFTFSGCLFTYNISTFPEIPRCMRGVFSCGNIVRCDFWFAGVNFESRILVEPNFGSTVPFLSTISYFATELKL
jgi:hypothetical protein